MHINNPIHNSILQVYSFLKNPFIYALFQDFKFQGIEKKATLKAKKKT